MSNKGISVYAEAMKRQKEGEKTEKRGKKTVEEEKSTASSTADNTPDSTASSTEVQPSLFPFSSDDLDDLKRKGYLPRTFKLSERDADWLEETVYRLSKDLKPRKAFQVDVVRIGMKLFEKVLSSDKKQLLKILEELR